MLRFLDIRRHPDSGISQDVAQSSRHIYLSIAFPLVFVALIWIVKLGEIVLGLDLGSLGVFPRRLEGLTGILTGPLVHQDIKHTLSNSVPFLVLGFLLYNSYRKVAFKVFLLVWLLEGLLVWIVGRPAFHIGASGIVYGFAFFLFFSGVFRMDMRSMALSLLVAFAYGGMVYGVFPLDMKISFEAHLMGAVVGAACAWYYREIDRAPEFRWEEEEEETDLPDKSWNASAIPNRLHVPPASFQSEEAPPRQVPSSVRPGVIKLRYHLRNNPSQNNAKDKNDG